MEYRKRRVDLLLLYAWIMALPLLLALFMLPKLALVYNQVTLPLQLLASRIAAGILTAAGIGVIREGNILDVAGHRVSVVEAAYLSSSARGFSPRCRAGVPLVPDSILAGGGPNGRGAFELAGN
jgi:hypothetical protein